MESSNKFLKNNDHNFYNGGPLTFELHTCEDCTQKSKKYNKEKKGDRIPKEIINLGYIDISYKGYRVNVRTPMMVCPFGFNKNSNSLNLQFTNYKTDSEMNSFFNFVQALEHKQMEYLGLNDDDVDLYLPQIRYDKKGKYDPNLLIKVPFRDNSYNVDIKTKDSSVSVTNIFKFSKLKCDIYIDKIWKFNDKYVCKWKVERILII